MGWLKDLFGGKSCGTGGNEPVKGSEKEPKDMSSLDELWTFINEECRNNPDHILEIPTTIQFSENNTLRKVHWIKFDGDELNYVRLDHSLNDNTTENILTKANMRTVLFDAAISGSSSNRTNRTYILSWETNWLTTKGMEPRMLNLAKKVLEESPAFTYGYVVNDWFVTGVNDDETYVAFFDEYGNRVAHRLWVLDAALSHSKLVIDDTKPPYVISDKLMVDPTLLPDDHWRRWVKITPAVNLAKAALKVVPRGVGNGKVGYYDITFDFDREDLAGVAFSVGTMLAEAISTTFPVHYGYNHHATYDRVHDSFMIPEAIQIKYLDQSLGLEEWLDLQRESKTNLERPYLSPNQPVVQFDGHKFQISSDYYIQFTPWDASK